MKNWFDKNKMTFSTNDKMLEERTKYKVYCKCGHSMVFYPMEHKEKKLCSWCGHYVYKDKKVEFNDKLNRLIKIEGVYQ